MDWIVVGVTGTLILVGVISGTMSLRRWLRSWRAQRAYRRGTDHIPLVFPVDVGVPANANGRGRGNGGRDFEAKGREGKSAERASAASRIRFDLTEDVATSATLEPPAVPAEPLERTTPAVPPSTAPVATRTPPEIETGEGPGSAVEGRQVTFHRADARTMRLLPGRLEIEEGEDERAEIRFVDLPGDPLEVTFGRRSGEPFRHVQLRSPTVSRNHARMTRTDTDWVISNLSETNPIVVSGQVLTGDDARVLQDGDRIEMGEVVFRYHFP